LSAPRTRARRAHRSYRPAVVAAALVALAAAPPALAAPGWTAPTPLGAQSQLSLAVDRDGKAVLLATWNAYGSGMSLTSYVRPVAPSSAWQPQVLGAHDCPGWCTAWGFPDVELDDHGDAVGMWGEGLTGPGNTVTTVATRAAGGAWSPIPLSPDENSLFWNTDESVAVGPDGTAVFVSNCGFCDNQGGSLIAARAVAPGQMAPRVYLSAVGEGPASPVAGVDAAGRATVAWVSSLGVRLSSRSLAGVWSQAATLTGGESFAPALAVAPSGAAELVWVGSDEVVRSSRRSGPDAGWTPPAPISPAPGATDPSYWSSPPSVAIDPGDKAVAAWAGSDGKIRAAVRPAGASWTTTTLPSTGTAPQVAVNPAGTAFVLFLGPAGAPLVSMRPAGGTWGPLVPLDGAGATVPRIATDGNGNAVAAWISATGELRTSTFDATGPVLGGVSVPGSATAGQVVPMSAAPWDLWSPVTATTFEFGDGTAAAGPATGHAYAQPGTYTVRVTAADAVGNTTATERSITVAAPAVTSSQPGPSGPVGTVGGVTVGLPGASPGSSPGARLSPAAARRLPALRVGVTGTGSFRAGTRGLLTLRLNRAVRRALVRVQIRRGLHYTTVTRGRVSGRRIPVALTFARRGRYLIRVQISEAHRATVNRLIRIAVRP
jgi:hypothetical protein